MDNVENIKAQQLHSTFLTFQRKKDLDSYLEFRTVYWEALNQVKDSETASYWKVVVENTERLFVAARTLKQDIPMWISNEILGLLFTPDNLATFLNIENSEEQLAWFCCDRASSYVYPDKISHEHFFRTILTNWTDTPYLLGRPSLDKVVSLIYGPACWELYGTELNEDMDPVELSRVVHDIANANLPFAFKPQVSQENSLAQPLPDSFM